MFFFYITGHCKMLAWVTQINAKAQNKTKLYKARQYNPRREHERILSTALRFSIHSKNDAELREPDRVEQGGSARKTNWGRGRGNPEAERRVRESWGVPREVEAEVFLAHPRTWVNSSAYKTKKGPFWKKRQKTKCRSARSKRLRNAADKQRLSALAPPSTLRLTVDTAAKQVGP